MYNEEIKATRLEKGITQVQLSKATGIPQNTISWIENSNGTPNIEQCVKLADFYEITIDELIGRELPSTNKTVNTKYYKCNF